MVRDIAFKIEQDEILISIPDIPLEHRIPHSVSYDRKSGVINGIGITFDDFEKSVASSRKMAENDVGFTRPFSLDTFDSKYSVALIEYMTFVVTDKAYKNEAKSPPFIFLPLPRYNYELLIPGYHLLPLATRQEFEYKLLNSPCTKSISINSQPSGWTKRQIQTIRRTQAIPFVLILFGVLFLLQAFLPDEILRRPMEGWFSIVSLTIFILALCVITAYIGLFVWFNVLKRWIPQELLFYHLERKPFFSKSLDRFFLKWIFQPDR